MCSLNWACEPACSRSEGSLGERMDLEKMGAKIIGWREGRGGGEGRMEKEGSTGWVNELKLHT